MLSASFNTCCVPAIVLSCLNLRCQPEKSACLHLSIVPIILKSIASTSYKKHGPDDAALWNPMLPLAVEAELYGTILPGPWLLSDLFRSPPTPSLSLPLSVCLDTLFQDDLWLIPLQSLCSKVPCQKGYPAHSRRYSVLFPVLNQHSTPLATQHPTLLTPGSLFPVCPLTEMLALGTSLCSLLCPTALPIQNHLIHHYWRVEGCLH